MTHKLQTRTEGRALDGALDVRFPTRALKDDGTFAGYGSVFGVVDSYGTRVVAGAFGASLKVKMPKMLRGHDGDRVIGGYTVAKEDTRGLYLEGAFDLDVQDGRETYSLVKKGHLDGLSIGFNTVKSADAKDGVRDLLELDLWEVSVVTFAANPAAAVADVRTEVDAVQRQLAAQRITTEREFEAFLRDAGGFSANRARAIASAGFKAAAGSRDADGGTSQLLQALRSARAALSQT